MNGLSLPGLSGFQKESFRASDNFILMKTFHGYSVHALLGGIHFSHRVEGALHRLQLLLLLFDWRRCR